MEFRHPVGLESYDRFFPNQDTMPILRYEQITRNGSPILPMYCLFPLWGQKSMSLLQRGG